MGQDFPSRHGCLECNLGYHHRCVNPSVCTCHGRFARYAAEEDGRVNRRRGRNQPSRRMLELKRGEIQR